MDARSDRRAWNGEAVEDRTPKVKGASAREGLPTRPSRIVHLLSNDGDPDWMRAGRWCAIGSSEAQTEAHARRSDDSRFCSGPTGPRTIVCQALRKPPFSVIEQRRGDDDAPRAPATTGARISTAITCTNLAERTFAMRRTTSPLAAASAEYFEGLEARFRADPDSARSGLARRLPDARRAFGTQRRRVPRRDAAAERLAAAYHRYGHLFADLDPLRQMGTTDRQASEIQHRRKPRAQLCSTPIGFPADRLGTPRRCIASMQTRSPSRRRISMMRASILAVEAFERASELPRWRRRRAALAQLVAAEEFELSSRSNGRRRSVSAGRRGSAAP